MGIMVKGLTGCGLHGYNGKGSNCMGIMVKGLTGCGLHGYNGKGSNWLWSTWV